MLAHLNHRLPQMCLRLLRAEVWAGKGRSKLQRVTTRVVSNDLLDVPAVIAHARIVAIGGDSQRLHEEIIVAGGSIQHGKWAGRLTQSQLEGALSSQSSNSPSESVKKVLLEIYPQLKGRLSESLEARVKERKAAIHRTLSARAEKEAKDIESILTELKRSIEEELDTPEYIQSRLAGFDDPETERYERNKEAMRARVKEIPEEIKRETEAIRARFAEPQARMFPVAVTFLVPEKMVK